MAATFDLIINIEKLFAYIVNLKLDQEVDFYIEHWDQKNQLYRKKLNPKKINSNDFNKQSYRSFYIISKSANFDVMKSPYDDEIFQYVVEVNGGKEDNSNIELIQFRRVAKQPDKLIDKVFQKMQRTFKKNEDFDKGVNWGNHFYKNIYYDKNINKKVWQNLNDKRFEIILSSTNSKNK